VPTGQAAAHSDRARPDPIGEEFTVDRAQPPVVPDTMPSSNGWFRGHLDDAVIVAVQPVAHH
jgi:hypothetical protein